jgi:ribosomal protein S27E
LSQGQNQKLESVQCTNCWRWVVVAVSPPKPPVSVTCNWCGNAVTVKQPKPDLQMQTEL